MKIILMTLPSKGRTPCNFPLGLGYIAKVLVNKGYSVEIKDYFGYQNTEKEIEEDIPKMEYDYIGISALTTQYNQVKWISKELKKYHKQPIILGGALATTSPEIVLNNTDVDICVIGDGENAVLEILDLKFKRGIYKSKENIRDLDSIPFPAWDMFPMEIYLNTPGSIEGYGTKSMNVITSRGCPYSCNFCSKTFDGVRFRSIDNIISEIKELIKKYDVKVINFSEELVMNSKERMYELCKKIKHLNLKWVCQGRVNMADYDLLKAMKKAGCTQVGYGIESGSQTILNNMNKNATVKMNEDAIINTRKAGIRPILQTMYGYVGETKETIQETIDLFDRVHAHPDGYCYTTPFPKTKLYEDCLKKGLIKDEIKYLENLKATGQFAVNLTDIPDEELIRLKKWSENKMYKNYYKYRREHPTIFLKDYSIKIKRLINYIKMYGLKKSIKDIYDSLRNYPQLIFQSE